MCLVSFSGSYIISNLTESPIECSDRSSCLCVFDDGRMDVERTMIMEEDDRDDEEDTDELGV